MSGVPARVVVASGQTPRAEAIDLPKLVMDVLGLSAPPADSDGPAQIREWDSLGALKIVLAVEEAYGVSLSEQELKAIASLAELAQVVESASALGNAAEHALYTGACHCGLVRFAVRADLSQAHLLQLLDMPQKGLHSPDREAFGVRAADGRRRARLVPLQYWSGRAQVLSSLRDPPLLHATLRPR